MKFLDPVTNSACSMQKIILIGLFIISSFLAIERFFFSQINPKIVILPNKKSFSYEYGLLYASGVLRNKNSPEERIPPHSMQVECEKENNICRFILVTMSGNSSALKYLNQERMNKSDAIFIISDIDTFEVKEWGSNHLIAENSAPLACFVQKLYIDIKKEEVIYMRTLKEKLHSFCSGYKKALEERNTSSIVQILGEGDLSW